MEENVVAPTNKSFLLPILVSVVITAIVSSTLTYVLVTGRQEQKLKTLSVNEVTPVIEPTSALLPTIITAATDTIYKKRLFDPQTLAKDIFEYPTELKNIPESELLGIVCSPRYYKQINGTFLYNSEDLDPNGEQTVGILESQIGKEINVYSQCETENGLTIAVVEAHSGGGGSENTAYLSLVSDITNPKIIPITPVGTTPFWGCPYPLMITKEQIMYVQCGGGEMLFNHLETYAVDLSRSSVKLLQKCASQKKDYSAPWSVTCTAL